MFNKILLTVLLSIMAGLSLGARVAPGESRAPEGTSLTAAIRQETVETLAQKVLELYVYPETAQKMARQLRENLKKGKYDGLTEFGQFATRLSEDLFAIAQDKHLSIYHSPSEVEHHKKFKALPQAEREAQLQAEMEGAAKRNYGFEKADILSGNIGYLRMSSFEFVHEASSATLTAALSFLVHCEALIIDLRDNSGGVPTMVQLLASHFFPYGEDDNTVLFESHVTYKKEMIPYRVLPQLTAQRMLHQPLFILVGPNSLSAAEVFAYTLQKMGRARVVGEQTHFGVNGTRGPEILNDHFMMKMPVQRMVCPVTGTSPEGVGVIPDFKTEGQAALAVVLKALHDKQRAENNSVETAPAAEHLKPFIGTYRFGPETVMTVSVSGNRLFVGVTGRPEPFEIFAVENERFNIPGMGIEVNFVRENGAVTGLHFIRGGASQFARKEN